MIPEFDQPAHVGYGWNFPGAETYTVCVGVEPWYDFCVEPPCGQVIEWTTRSAGNKCQIFSTSKYARCGLI